MKKKFSVLVISLLFCSSPVWADFGDQIAQMCLEGKQEFKMNADQKIAWEETDEMTGDSLTVEAPAMAVHFVKEENKTVGQCTWSGANKSPVCVQAHEKDSSLLIFSNCKN